MKKMHSARLAGKYIALDKADDEPLNRQLYRSLRDGITSGLIPAGEKLPSSRIFAANLSVSRNTVVAAYDQLALEGYTSAKRGGGTLVAKAAKAFASRKVTDTVPASPVFSNLGLLLQRDLRSDRLEVSHFQTGSPDGSLFPSDLWARLLRRSARLGGNLGGYEHFTGLPCLQEAIVRHLVQSRGVVAKPEQVIVVSTAQSALDLTARLFINPSDTVLLEEPGYMGMRIAAEAANATLISSPVDEFGIDVSSLDYNKYKPKLIYVTPSHQYPLGHVMSLERRLALLELAENTGAFIIEDDYDSEFHFDGDPVSSLYGLDHQERVIYVGTFAKTMMPAHRVAYIVVPPALITAYRGAVRNAGCVPGHNIQQATAWFLEEGFFRAHLRQMTGVYQTRRDQLIASLKAWNNPALEISCPAGGMQLVVKFDAADIQDDIVRNNGLKQGYDFSPLSPFYLGAQRCQGLLLGFANMQDKNHDSAMRVLKSCIP